MYSGRGLIIASNMRGAISSASLGVGLKVMIILAVSVADRFSGSKPGRSWCATAGLNPNFRPSLNSSAKSLVAYCWNSSTNKENPGLWFQGSAPNANVAERICVSRIVPIKSDSFFIRSGRCTSSIARSSIARWKSMVVFCWPTIFLTIGFARNAASLLSRACISLRLSPNVMLLYSLSQ